MKILGTKINWMRGWANNPSVQVLVDKLPPLEDLVYEQRGSLYFAEKDGYVSFFSWRGPDNEDGFGGREYPIMTKNGPVTLKGPWSSSSCSMNSAGFESCMEVSMTEDPAAFDRGYTFLAGAMTIKALRPALAKIGIEINGDHGYYYISKDQDPQN